MSCVTKIAVSDEAPANPQEGLLQAIARQRVERAERLVEQHQPRRRGQRARDADTLLLSSRELVRVTIAHERRIELHQLQQFVARAPRSDRRSHPSSVSVMPTFSPTVMCGNRPTR